MASGNLEAKLGELAGSIQSLTPALTRLEGRVNETRDRVVSLEANLQNITRQVQSLNTRFQDFQNRMQSSLDDKVTKKTMNPLEFQDVKRDVEHLKGFIKEKKNRAWDIVKIALGVIVPAIIGAVGAIVAKGV